jgi:hypothetical protein
MGHNPHDETIVICETEKCNGEVDRGGQKKPKEELVTGQIVKA